MRHPPQAGRALKAEGISPNGELGNGAKAREGRGGSELRLNEKYFPFTHNIRTGAALDI